MYSTSTVIQHSMNRLTMSNKRNLLPKLPINMRTIAIPQQFTKTSIKLSTINIGTKLLTRYPRGIYTKTAAHHNAHKLNPLYHSRRNISQSIISNFHNPSVKSTNGIFRYLTWQLRSTKSYYMLKASMHAIDNQIKKHPLLSAALMAGVKGLAADFIAQYVIENKSFDDINWHRNGLFGLIGVTYTGFILYGLYIKLYPTLFRGLMQSRLHWSSKAFIQSTIDQFAHTAMFYFPFFYAFKAGVYDGFTIENCSNAVKKYFTEYIYDDFKVSASLWIPVNMITFGFMPPHLKAPWTITASFVWYVMLSVLRGDKQEDMDQQNHKAVGDGKE